MKKILFPLFVFLLAGCSKNSLNESNNTGGQNGVGGSLARFTLAGNYLYVVDETNLKTFDVTNPANPILKNSTTIGSNIETIYPYKSNLFIGSQNGMFIYSLTNPEAPQFSGSATHVRSCDPVVANDTAAFVTLRGSGQCGAARDGLYSYNVFNLQSPLLKSVIDLTTPYGLGLKDSTLFVCRGSNGLAVVNVTNISNPIVLQTLMGNDFRDVIPYNDLLICYVTDGLALYDISNISNIQYIKKILN